MLYIFISAFILVCLFQLAFLLPINPDEREHLHNAYLIVHGQTPYIDFFEHHHPLLWYLTTPLIPFLENTAQIWYVLRTFQTIILLITSIYIYKIAVLSGLKPWESYLTTVIYFCFDIVRITGVEFRPDTLMICFFIIGLYEYYKYLQNQKTSTLSTAFLFFFISFLTFQKAPLFFAIPCLYLFIQCFKNKKICTDFFIAALPSATLAILLFFYLWHKGMWSTYFELNWELNFRANQSMTFLYNPLTSKQINILIFCLLCACWGLWQKKSFIIKQISLIYILYACFAYNWRIHHFQYMLPFYPLAALILGYLLAHLCQNKPRILKYLTCCLCLLLAHHLYQDITFLKHSRKNLSTYIMWEQKALDYTTPDDVVLYTKAGEEYFGGLRKQAIEYYGFSLGGIALLDYNFYHRHPYPNLNQIIQNKHPKIVFNGHWNDCSIVDGKCVITQQLDTSYMNKHYIDKGIFYLRKD